MNATNSLAQKVNKKIGYLCSYGSYGCCIFEP